MKRLATLLVFCIGCSCAPAKDRSALPLPANHASSTTDTPAAPGMPVDDGVAPPEASESAPVGRYAKPPTGVVVESQVADASAATAEGQFNARPAESGPPRSRRSAAAEAPATSAQPPALGDARGDEGAASAMADRMAAPRAETKGRASEKALAPSSAMVRPPEPEDRPGLGTTWGETRYSSVSEVPFVRDSSRPSYTATVHYNDETGAAALAGHRHSYTPATVGLGAALSLTLLDEYGNALSAYRGNGHTVAVGYHGQRYMIRIRNNTNERFEVVVSVDGLDVIDGQGAGFAKRGYLVAPFGEVDIDGFRQSAAAVAAFRFGSVRDSYAAKTGSARNVGVIGAAAFGEVGYSARLRAYQERMYALRMQGIETTRRHRADPFPNGFATPPLELAR
jgi:hypothetical protein